VTEDVAVLDALRAAILDGEFAAGQRLVEVDLCERFGCSRSGGSGVRVWAAAGSRWGPRFRGWPVRG
jgi:hypothetical protein